ncbi:hypothetical protein GGR55DRAFT_631719 [Xylaria sp. FL0064]|nr:hypothetical protein GGR55DRAFT_631719 [Xylaria sp. FL0064]
MSGGSRSPSNTPTLSSRILQPLSLLSEAYRDSTDFLSVVADSDNKVMAESLSVSPSYVSENDSKISQDQADSTDDEDSSNRPEGIIATEQDHGDDHPKPSSFLGLPLSSDYNQMYSLTRELKSFKSEEKKLLRKRAAVDSEVEAVRKKQKRIEAQVNEHQESVRAERNAACISEELWREYENFCETLEPNEYQERRWFVWNESYNDSYSEYDPKFESLSSAVGGKSGPWRCECVATYTESGTPIEYQVDYHALKLPMFKTWGSLFPALYDGAVNAARQGSLAALDMLVALPGQLGRVGSGYAFEFRFEESRSSHPDPSRRWGFRAAHNIHRPLTKQAKRNTLIKKLRLPLKIE